MSGFTRASVLRLRLDAVVLHWTTFHSSSRWVFDMFGIVYKRDVWRL
jgi:hypothetical protein